jgi:hypothetical protein
MATFAAVDQYAWNAQVWNAECTYRPIRPILEIDTCLSDRPDTW